MGPKDPAFSCPARIAPGWTGPFGLTTARVLVLIVLPVAVGVAVLALVLALRRRKREPSAGDPDNPRPPAPKDPPSKGRPPRIVPLAEGRGTMPGIGSAAQTTTSQGAEPEGGTK